MHRTQILLEDWQHDALKAGADQRGISISELVREILSKHFKPKRSRTAFEEVAGIGEDHASVARDHDAFLYGKRSKGR